MPEFDLGDVIAYRTLSHAGQAVTVEVGAPQSLDGDNGDFYCPYFIQGLPDGPVAMLAYGIDSIQALLIALAAIGDRLESLGSSLTFLDGKRLGFPVTESSVEDHEWVTTTRYPQH